MALFTGRYENKVDGKGRVSLPADYRDLLAQGNGDKRSFYIFPSPNVNCLEACDRGFITRIAASIEAQTEMFSQEEEALSQIIAQAMPINYDSTGRFVLPVDFMGYADLYEKALFIGKMARFQIWNPAAYITHALNAKTNNKGLTLKLLPAREGGA
jgi:MraZ protein